jgi:uncharacterized protein
VILVDANLLVYAGVSSLPQHEPARSWLDAQLSGPNRVGLPWASLLGYLRLVTNPRAFARPEPVVEAWRQVQMWLSAPPAWIPQPGERHAVFLGELFALPGIYGNLIPDAHLAALAIEHGLTLCSADTDFARFPRLSWTNPLLPDLPRRR